MMLVMYVCKIGLGRLYTVSLLTSSIECKLNCSEISAFKKLHKKHMACAISLVQH